jgi:hypothetical protein
MFDLSNAFVEYSGCRDVAATAFNADHSLGLRIAIDRDLATTAIGDQNTAHIDLMLPNADITVEAHVGLSVDAAIDTCTDAYPLPLVDEVWHATGGSIEVSVEYVDGPDPYQVYATITLTNVTFARVEPGPSSDAPVLPSLSFETSVAWGPWGWQPGDGLGP